MIGKTGKILVKKHIIVIKKFHEILLHLTLA